MIKKDSSFEEALINSKSLKYIGGVVELPVEGWIDENCEFHFYKDGEKRETVYIPEIILKEAEL
jgi:hypothetical protein